MAGIEVKVDALVRDDNKTVEDIMDEVAACYICTTRHAALVTYNCCGTSYCVTCDDGNRQARATCPWCRDDLSAARPAPSRMLSDLRVRLEAALHRIVALEQEHQVKDAADCALRAERKVQINALESKIKLLDEEIRSKEDALRLKHEEVDQLTRDMATLARYAGPGILNGTSLSHNISTESLLSKAETDDLKQSAAQLCSGIRDLRSKWNNEVVVPFLDKIRDVLERRPRLTAPEWLDEFEVEIAALSEDWKTYSDAIPEFVVSTEALPIQMRRLHENYVCSTIAARKLEAAKRMLSKLTTHRDVTSKSQTQLLGLCDRAKSVEEQFRYFAGIVDRRQSTATNKTIGYGIGAGVSAGAAVALGILFPPTLLVSVPLFGGLAAMSVKNGVSLCYWEDVVKQVRQWLETHRAQIQVAFTNILHCMDENIAYVTELVRRLETLDKENDELDLVVVSELAPQLLTVQRDAVRDKLYLAKHTAAQ